MSISAAPLEDDLSPSRAAPPAVAQPVERLEQDARVTRFVHAHYPFVWRILRRFGLAPADADDAAQQVFLSIVPRLTDIEPGKERAFLFRTAMHTASRAHRSRRRRAEDVEEASDERVDGSPSPDVLLDQRRARALLDRILDEMPVDLKTVLVLFEIEGLTMAEMAAALDVPPGTVASRLRRARAELEARVARHRGGKPSGE